MRANQLAGSSRSAPARPTDGPPLDYLAKDYASFRQLIADRMAGTLPQWTETHPPDVGVAIAEMLAYVGDQLSYYQDAVATEAYLATARQRASIRRHVRLIGSCLHEGCNARVWLSLNAATNDVELDPATVVFATVDRAESQPPTTIQGLGHEESELAGRQVFEPLDPGPGGVIRVRVAHNTIRLDEPLAVGATVATLRSSGSALSLQPGDVLIFEPGSNSVVSACVVDTSRRQAVRLTDVRRQSNGSVLVTWDDVDALGFSLEETGAEEAGGGGIARGNVVLAHHGRQRAGTTGRWCQGGILGSRHRQARADLVARLSDGRRASVVLRSARADQ